MPSDGPSTTSGAPAGPTGAVTEIGGHGHRPSCSFTEGVVDERGRESEVPSGIEQRVDVEVRRLGQRSDQAREVAAGRGIRDQGVETRLADERHEHDAEPLAHDEPAGEVEVRASPFGVEREARCELRGAGRRAEGETQQLLQRRPLGMPRAVRAARPRRVPRRGAAEPRGRARAARRSGAGRHPRDSASAAWRWIRRHRRPMPRRPRCAPCSRRPSRTSRSRRRPRRAHRRAR